MIVITLVSGRLRAVVDAIAGEVTSGVPSSFSVGGTQDSAALPVIGAVTVIVAGASDTLDVPSLTEITVFS